MKEQTALGNFRKQNRQRKLKAQWRYGDLSIESYRFHAYCIETGRGAQTKQTLIDTLVEAINRYAMDKLPLHARACEIALRELKNER